MLEIIKQIFLEKIIVVFLPSFFAGVIVKVASADLLQKKSLESLSGQVLSRFEFPLINVQLPLHYGIPVVLNSVVSPPSNQLCEHCPFISVELMQKKEDPLLLLTPVLLGDGRVQMVEPSLPALLSLSPGNSLGDLGPLGGAKELY